jgi:type VII secretion-associated protein (TIGR03931 family)
VLVTMVAVGVTLAALLAGQGLSDRQIAENHYRFAVPDGWQRRGAGQDSNRLDLAPADRTGQADRIFIVESELTYDAGGDAARDRAVAELRTQYDDRRAGTTPPPVDGFDPSASFAGRDVLHYTERVTAGTVDWYVLFTGRYQVSVGCQHDDADDAGAERVRTACERVVSTISILPGGK